ncbi:MAG: GNAT family N-acetyltransferase [Clostridia bacterium]|nr:GNAT family N-acetyltransferase [Clostridia bacterium]
MENLPQLIMRNSDLSSLAPINLGDGYSVHTHTDGNEGAWEEIIESAFDTHYDFDFLIKAGDYAPERVFYISYLGRDVATTTAVENPKYAKEGWLRMVGVRKEESGKGLGKQIILIALHSLRERGYKSVVLSTDDFRIPALCSYLSLGFRPVYSHESHRKRWEDIRKQLPDRFAAMI